MEMDIAILTRTTFKPRQLRVVVAPEVRLLTSMDMLWHYKLEGEVTVLLPITSYPWTDPCALYDAYRKESL
jgi:hypothetical protein